MNVKDVDGQDHEDEEDEEDEYGVEVGKAES